MFHDRLGQCSRHTDRFVTSFSHHRESLGVVYEDSDLWDVEVDLNELCDEEVPCVRPGSNDN